MPRHHDATRSIPGGGLALALAAALATGQEPVPEPKDPPTAADVGAAVERWLASDHTDDERLADTVDAVLQAPAVGLPVLGALLPAAAERPAAPRSKGLYDLCKKVVLEFVRRTRDSGMVFVGQYDALEALQPFAGELLFTLLLETPEWYPLTFRDRLVAPLRDLQQRLPSQARLDAITAIIDDEREPTALRQGLAAMMWQWGKREYAERFVRRLQAATVEGDAEDRVQATLNLADYHNLLRDYKAAARAHRTAQALAADADVELRPVAWYAAACVHALLGDRERGMQALERCARMHASPHLDKSLRLERKLFERDPEIALLRAEPRFAELLELAFGEREQPEEREQGREDRRDDDDGRE